MRAHTIYMEDFRSIIEPIAQDFGVVVKDVLATEVEDFESQAYDVVLSGDTDDIRSFIYSNEEVANYELYSTSTSTRGDTVLLYVSTSDGGEYLDAIIGWCKKFGLKPMKDKKLVALNKVKDTYENSDTMDVVDDVTKTRLYHISFSSKYGYRVMPLCKALEHSRFKGDTIKEFKEDLEEAGFDADNIEII